MLAVTGMGMVSALGLGVEGSCAASRAGILRISPLDEVSVYDESAQQTEPARGHTIPMVSEGFTGLGRLTALACAGLRDLARHTPWEGLSRCGLYLALSNDFHRRLLAVQEVNRYNGSWKCPRPPVRE